MGAETGAVAMCRWHASAFRLSATASEAGRPQAKVLPGNEKFQPTHKEFAGILWQIYRSWIQCTVLRWHGAFFAAVNRYPWDNEDRMDTKY